MVTHIAGLIDDDLRLPALEPAEAPAPSREQTARAAKMRDVLESWANWSTHESMCGAMAATAAGSPREAYGRNALGRRLENAVSFTWLASDSIDSDGLDLYGERIEGIEYFALGNEGVQPPLSLPRQRSGLRRGIHGWIV